MSCTAAMVLMLSAHRKLSLLLCVTLLLAATLLATVPFHVHTPAVWSDSYMFGYSNRAGEAIVILLALGLWLVGKQWNFIWPAAGMSSPSLDLEMPRRLLFRCLTLAAGSCAFFTWATYRAGGVGDGAYFLDRIHLIERGQVPYRDFEFVYGSFSLYASIFLGKLLGCGSTAGYYLLWTAETLLGIVLLWQAIRLLDLPAGGKRTVFLLTFALALLCTSASTLNYCILRYSLPFFVVCLPSRLDRSAGVGHRILLGVSLLIGVTLLLGISPEEAIALAVAFLLYLPMRRMSLRRPWVLDEVLLAVAFFAVYRFAMARGAFGTMGRFGAGAFNLPLVPGMYLLLFLSAFLLVVLFHASGRICERAPANLAFVLIYGFGMLPGALGRADMIHLIGYELPIMWTALLLMRIRPAAWRTAVLSFAVIVFVLQWCFPVPGAQPTLSKALLYQLYAKGVPTSSWGRWVDGYVNRKAAHDLGPALAVMKMGEIEKAARGGHMEPSELFPGLSPVVMTPFQYLPNKLSVYQSPAIDEGYFMGLSNVTDPAQIQEKLDELRRYPERDLLVSYEGLDQCLVHSASHRAIGRLLLALYLPEPRYSVYTFVPMCTFLQDNYHWAIKPSQDTYGYGVMRHN